MEILYINTVIYFQSAHTLKYDKICMQRFCKAWKDKFKKLILIDILMRNTFKIRCLRAWRPSVGPSQSPPTGTISFLTNERDNNKPTQVGFCV